MVSDLSALQPRMQQCKNSPKTTFTKITVGFLVLCSYWLEFYKCFSLGLLLAVPTIVYINLAESIIRVT